MLSFRLVAIAVLFIALGYGVAFGAGVAYGRGNKPVAQTTMTQQQIQSLIGAGGGANASPAGDARPAGGASLSGGGGGGGH